MIKSSFREFKANLFSSRVVVPAFVIVAAIFIGLNVTRIKAVGGLVFWGILFILSFWYPEKAFLVYVAALPWMPEWAGFMIPPLNVVTLTRAVGSAVMLGILLQLLRRGSPRLLSTPMDMLALFYLFNLIVVQRLFMSQTTISDMIRSAAWDSMAFVLPVIIISRFGADLNWTKKFMKIVLVSVSICAILAIFESLTKINPFLLVPYPALPVQALPLEVRMERYGIIRVEGAFNEAIDLGLFCGLGIILALGLQKVIFPKLNKFSGSVLLLILLFGLISTLSGTPFLATVIGMVVILVFRPSEILSWRLFFASLLIGVILLLLPQSQRVLDIVLAFFQIDTPAYVAGGIQGNTVGRLEIYGLFAPMILKSPFLGYGSLMLARASELSADIPSRYIIELLNGGLLGLTSFLLPSIWALICVMRVYLQTKAEDIRALALTIFAILLQILAFFFVKYDLVIVWTYYWMFLGLSEALTRIPKSENSPIPPHEGISFPDRKAIET